MTDLSSGASVSICENGSILAVGGQGDDLVGATWLFRFNGSQYEQLGDKLVGSKSLGFAYQG